MKCNNCGAELNDNAKFCNSCGTPVANMNSQPQGALNQGMNNQPQGAPNPNMNYGPVTPPPVGNPPMREKVRMGSTEKIIAIILVIVVSIGLVTASILSFTIKPRSSSLFGSTYRSNRSYNYNNDYDDDYNSNSNYSNNYNNDYNYDNDYDSDYDNDYNYNSNGYSSNY